MMNEMVARYFFYKLGSASYGDSKLEKWKITIKKTIFHSLSLIYGKQAVSDAKKNGTIFNRNYIMVSKEIVLIFK